MTLDVPRLGGPRLPCVLQAEAAECGLACLCMLACYHGHATDLAGLRVRFPPGVRGCSLNHLVGVAQRLGLGCRAVRAEPHELAQLRLPCIVHWQFRHFVVLHRVHRGRFEVHDPACGARRLSAAEFGAGFTGVALELWPDASFVPAAPPPRLRLRDVSGRLAGLRRFLGHVLVLSLLLELMALLNPFYTQWIVDHVLVTGDRDLLGALLVGFTLLLFGRQAVELLRAWLILYTGTRLHLQWRSNIVGHLLALPLPFFEHRTLGDIVSRIDGADAIQHTLTGEFLEALLDGVVALLTLAALLVYSPRLSALALATIALYTLLRLALHAPLRAATQGQVQLGAIEQGFLLETVRGARTIKLMGAAQSRRVRWLDHLVGQINGGLRLHKLGLVLSTSSALLLGVDGVLTLWLGAGAVLDAELTTGMLLAFIAYKAQFQGRVSSLIDKYFALRLLGLHVERLADIVLSQPEQVAPGAPPPAPAALEAVELGLRHADDEPWVLRGLSFRIEPGHAVAVIGPSGCGKSTLLQLLLGAIAPSSGRLLLGNIDLARVDLDAWRGQIGCVLQDDQLFAGSILDNIAFFDAAPDAEWAARCAAVAQVHDDIAAMPLGYQTLVGDLGVHLSGGQRQRIMLARALYKRPRLLLLDEATSHLDGALEQRVAQALAALGMTCIHVTHRAAVHDRADLVLDLGARRAG